MAMVVKMGTNGMLSPNLSLSAFLASVKWLIADISKSRNSFICKTGEASVSKTWLEPLLAPIEVMH